MSHRPERNKRCDHEPVELYEQVNPAVLNRSSHSQSRYVEPSFQPTVTSVAPSDSIATQGVTKERKRLRSTILIVLTSTILLCLLVVSLVAVILYSPQVRTSSESAMENLLSRIQRLEAQLETKQTPNQTQAALSSLQEQQESFEATLTSQFKNVQNLVQSMSSVQSNSASTLTQLREDFQDNLLLSPLHNLTVVQATVDQLSTSVITLTSQLVSVQNLIQGITSVQNNFRQDLNRLRSVDLYRGCTQNTRTCTMTTGSSNYYWRSCTASSIYINPTVSYLCMWFKLTFLNCAQYSSQDTQYYTVDIRCDYSTNYGYIESSTLYKNVNNYYSCYCDVTRLSGSTSSTHSTLSSSFSSTCTLTVTRCPRSLNLLI